MITADECRTASLQMKINKAADADGIQAEHFKNVHVISIVILLGYVQESLSPVCFDAP